MTDFAGVLAPLAQALTKRGYTQLTQVQEAVLAPELENADALVSAQTGSGKTVAFGMALAPTLLGGAERFSGPDAPLALAVAPTRELALQVKRELEWLYAETGARVASCVGGMDMRQERRALDRGAHIVVGTPGRLRDHIERGSLDTSAFKAVVLDEADEMLDLGFRDDLEYILDAAPKDRRTLMFSATVGRTIANLAKRYQNDAVRITTQGEKGQHLDIEYRSFMVAPNDRENAIINVLRYYDAKNTIIFCGTRANVNHMTSRLNNRGFSVVALSGELSQNERTHALQAMRDGRARVCVATDVAARGIDLPNLDLVIHADIPKGKESLLHRSGRTGRAGRKGVSALIVPFNWRKRTERLLENAKITADWAKPPSVEDIAKLDKERIMDDPRLSEPLSVDEVADAQDLLQKFSAEQLAVAFLRLHNAGKPAAEELIEGNPRDFNDKQDRGPRAQRQDFDNGVWFRLSVGRKHQAEPRWLLPMLCRAGHITKRDIGAIKIHGDETHVELTPEASEKFMEAIGPSRKVEKSITVDRMKGVPEAPKDKHGHKDKFKGNFKDGDDEGRRKPFGPRKPYDKDKYKGKNKGKPASKRHADKPFSGGPIDVNDLVDRSPSADEPSKFKKKKKPSFKPKGDKPHAGKTKSGKFKSGKSFAGGKPGSRPLKRKKPKGD
ncbi:DEAD/DEAH box helicase [Magnetovibrio sp. PR-2]|uniref:DEAD/DEAH box helicase n=1 Tax=Magnetovibrio sp. PR-2 TaxID=3120356 RepID=UPI002FCDFD6B